MRFRMLNTVSREKGDPCYLPKGGGIITPDKSKARTWKTWEGIVRALNTKGYAQAGYEVESFEEETK
jgi:hypothetical protein